MKKLCKYCGCEFYPKIRSTQEYCSLECRDKASGRIRYTSGTTGICKECGKEFIKRYGNERMCSDECKRKSTKKSQANYFKRTYVPTGSTQEQCEWCGAETNGKKYCSKQCEEKARWKREVERKYGSWEAYQEEQNLKREKQEQVKAEKQKQIEQARVMREQARAEKKALAIQQKEQRIKERTLTKECVVCGTVFTTLNPAQKTCCKRCGKRLDSSRKHHRIPKERIIDKDITLEALYRRDSGVCYLCGKQCDWNDRDKDNNIVGSQYPSIDHVTPIAKGGVHAWDNVRLAHFECNWKKNDKLLEEIDKFGEAVSVTNPTEAQRSGA